MELVAIEREDVTEIGFARTGEAGEGGVGAYEEAVVVRPSHLAGELHEAPTGALSMLAEQVVELEGLLHVDEVVARIRDGWGLRRAGARIQSAVARAIDVSVRRERLVRDGDFLSIPGRGARLRDRSDAASSTLRRAEMLPPAEIRVAVLGTVRANFGATKDQIVQAVSRAMGIRQTSAQVRGVIAEVVRAAVADGELVRQGDLVTVPA